MSAHAVDLLTALAQALSALALYPEGHRSREKALDSLAQKLSDLQDKHPNPQFSFLGDEVVFGNMPLREMRTWDWGKRLAEAGIQRLQFDQRVTRDELEEFIDEMLARLTLRAIDTSEARQTRRPSIQWGAIGIAGEDPTKPEEELVTASVSFTLGEEAETIRWMHEELQTGHGLPLQEAEAVVRALSVAMHGDQQVMLPLLKLRQFDEYTTTHSINVSVLTMSLAEWMGMGARDVRAFGIAGLLHDLGKVKVPKDVLNKAGKLTPEERDVMNQHPTEGARIIIATEQHLELAAVVAYEHHIMLNGGGYPALRYSRDCHSASMLVHVCDVYDALRTDRPYREAWASERVLTYLEERAGAEFEPEASRQFVQMIREREPRIAAVTEDQALPG